MLIASAAGGGPGRFPPRAPGPQTPRTPQERARLARQVAAACLPGPSPCRACVLDVVEELVRLALEDAERDFHRRLKEQTQWPN